MQLEFEPTLTPLLRLKPITHLYDGIFSPFERTEICQINEKASKSLIEIEADIDHPHRQWEEFNPQKISFTPLTSTPIQPLDLLDRLGEKIENDICFLKREPFSQKVNSVHGSQNDIWIHNSAKVNPLCSIEAENGPVVIDAGAEISAFSLLKGPVYVGIRTCLQKALVSNVRFGKENRIGGEVSNSLFGDFTNKYHEGFIGHSLIGDWVNLGALSTTSNLKNNYGKIKLHFPIDGEKKVFSTDSLKFGSIIGDFCKTAIGTLLNTGTILDTATQWFGSQFPPKYTSPFSWGESEIYNEQKFFTDLKVVMSRRKQKLSSIQEKRIKAIYKSNLI